MGLAVWLAISMFLTSVTYEWGLLAYLSPVPTFLITVGVAVVISETSRRRTIRNQQRADVETQPDSTIPTES
jgi:hypothetical protein